MRWMLLTMRSVSVNAIAYLLVYVLLGIGLAAIKIQKSRRLFRQMLLSVTGKQPPD